MYKRLEFYPEDENNVEIDLIHPGVLEKTADMSSDLKEFIQSLQPEENKIYILVNALGAGEYYSSNRNGDFIAEDVLKKFYKSFEESGRVYKHHKNKDPQRSLGNILYASYNPEMHRVELVCEIRRDKNERFVQRILDGDYPPVSMGMRTPNDECSICHNKARSRAEYCSHLKREMNKIYPDGRKVMAINPKAKFFDISFVMIGADPTAGVMRKVASGQTATRTSAELGEEFLKTQGLKEADIYKRLDNAEVKAVSEDPKGLIYWSQPLIPLDDIKRMTKEASLAEILSTLLGMRIMPKPQDFQRIVLMSRGEEAAARTLDNKNICLIRVTNNTKPTTPDDVRLSNFQDRLAKSMKHLIPERAMTKPLVVMRVLEKTALLSDEGTTMEQEGHIPQKEPSQVKKFLFGHKDKPKMSPVKNPALTSGMLSGLYYGLQRAHQATSGAEALGKMDAFLLKRPWLIPLLWGAGTVGSVSAQRALQKEGALKDTLTHSLIAVPASYLYAGAQEQKVRKGKPIGKFQNFVREHPFLTSIFATAGMGKAKKWTKKLTKVSTSRRHHLEKWIQTMSPEKLDQVFNEVITL